MRIAVQALVESQGGFVVVSDGVVFSLLPLPLCGLMSETPFMALSFVSLPTVPELGITDHGLVDVKQNKITSLFLG
jgi:adenine deaminase